MVVRGALRCMWGLGTIAELLLLWDARLSAKQRHKHTCESS